MALVERTCGLHGTLYDQRQHEFRGLGVLFRQHDPRDGKRRPPVSPFRVWCAQNLAEMRPQRFRPPCLTQREGKEDCIESRHRPQFLLEAEYDQSFSGQSLTDLLESLTIDLVNYEQWQHDTLKRTGG